MVGAIPPVGRYGWAEPYVRTCSRLEERGDVGEQSVNRDSLPMDALRALDHQVDVGA